MSYTRSTGLGDAFSDLLKCGSGVVGTIAGGAVDPYLPEAICRLSQLQALNTGRTPVQALLGKRPTVPVPACKTTPPAQKSIGVGRVVKPLRALVYVNKHPTAVWLGVTAVLGIPMLMGYFIGKAAR